MLFLIIFSFYITNSATKNISSEIDVQNDFVRSPTASEYFQNVMGCGAAGWCYFRCCSSAPAIKSNQVYRSPISRRNSPQTYSAIRNYPMSISENQARLPYNGVTNVGTPFDVEVCPKACQPQCLERCLQRYQMIVASFMNSLTANDMGINDEQILIPKEIASSQIHSLGFRVEDDDLEEPLCRAECMPRCTAACISNIHRNENQHKCRPTCMPQCSSECLRSPPIMVPCPQGAAACYCPAGYVQCSENTCCMRYRTMAVRYNNHLASYAFGDEAAQPKNATEEAPSEIDNEMSVLVKNLRKMGASGTTTKGSSASKTSSTSKSTFAELPKNGTVIYYPKEMKAEIVFNDGEVLVENLRNN